MQLGAVAGGPQLPRPTTTGVIKKNQPEKMATGETLCMRRMEGLESDGDWAGVQAPGVQLGAVALAGGPQLPEPITTGLENNKKEGEEIVI